MRGLTRVSRRLLPTLCLLAGSLGIAVPAAAAVGCTFDESAHEVSVSIDAAETATLARSDSAITVNGSACGSATVSNTDTIDVLATGTDTTLVIDLSGGPFEPGYTAEGSGTSEIELATDLLSGRLTVLGTSGSDIIAIGSAGINLNGAESSPDKDVGVTYYTVITVTGGDGNDRLTAYGGLGTGSTWNSAVTIDGGAGNDRLAGSSTTDQLGGGDDTDLVDYSVAPYSVLVSGLPNGTVTSRIGSDELTGVESVNGSPYGDTVYGGPGPDVFRGGGGDDSFRGFAGDDLFVGGPGDDHIDLSRAKQRVRVDLKAGTARGEGRDVLRSVENVTGSRFADRVVGTGRRNLVWGGGGSDVVVLAGGDDEAYGEDGSDTLKVGPGDDFAYGADGSDLIDGASGYDVCFGGPGDTIRRCEIVTDDE